MFDHQINESRSPNCISESKPEEEGEGEQDAMRVKQVGLRSSESQALKGYETRIGQTYEMLSTVLIGVLCE